MADHLARKATVTKPIEPKPLCSGSTHLYRRAPKRRKRKNGSILALSGKISPKRQVISLLRDKLRQLVFCKLRCNMREMEIRSKKNVGSATSQFIHRKIYSLNDQQLQAAKASRPHIRKGGCHLIKPKGVVRLT